MSGASLPCRCREPRPPRLRRGVGERRCGACAFRGARGARLRRRHAAPFVRTARDPHLYRRGYHRDADGIGAGRNSPPSRGRGRGLPASFIPLSSFPRKRESRSSSWLRVFVRDFWVRTKTRSHEEGEAKSTAPRPLPPAGGEKGKNRFPTLFGCASLDPGSFASWTKAVAPGVRARPGLASPQCAGYGRGKSAHKAELY